MLKFKCFSSSLLTVITMLFSLLCIAEDVMTEATDPECKYKVAEKKIKNNLKEQDPTKPLYVPLLKDFNVAVDADNRDPNHLDLTAIFFNKNKKKAAVINGKLLKEGDTIQGKIIKTITPNMVIITENTETIELKLPDFSIKQEAS